MNLAINYSRPAAKLVQSDEIEIDYFKTPDWEWIVEEAKAFKPVAVHYTLEAGNNSLGEVDWNKVRKLCQLTNTPYINLHLDARQSYYPDLAVDTKDSQDIDRVYKIILSDVMAVVELFGKERVIVENSPYQGEEGNTMQLCVEVELISRLIEETGCGLLLDISHAFITAKTLDIDPYEYIAHLPVNRTKELHFAGMHWNPMSGRWQDHLAIREDDWALLNWVLDNIHSGKWNSPWLLAFEYGGVGEPFEWRTDPVVIAEQVPRLYQCLQLTGV
jgi:uncharacterized protein (UPF0276 family)